MAGITPGMPGPTPEFRMRSTLIALAALALAALALAAPAGAQQDTGPNAGANVRGVVRPAPAPSLAGVPAAHRPAVERTLRRLLDATMRSPVLASPVGFDLGPTLHGYTPRNASANPPLAAYVTGHIFWQAYQPGIGRVAPTPVSMAAFYVVVNDITRIWSGLERWARDEQGQMYWEPARDGERGGFPYYSTDVVVLTNIARPIIVPVSRERVLRHELATHRKTLAALHASQSELRATSAACVAAVEGRLAALSATERAAPAHLSLVAPPGTPRGARCTYLVDADAPHARRIAVENPDFFDPSLPRTAVQLIMVDHSALGKRTGRGWRLEATERIRHGIDYAALAALLETP
jgi:hypothetical protein